MCDAMELRFARFKRYAKAILMDKGLTNNLKRQPIRHRRNITHYYFDTRLTDRNMENCLKRWKLISVSTGICFQNLW